MVDAKCNKASNTCVIQHLFSQAKEKKGKKEKREKKSRTRETTNLLIMKKQITYSYL